MTYDFTDKPEGAPRKPEMLTQEQAIALYESEFWKDMDMLDRATFQMNERRLCMPFDVFHQAVEFALQRSVWTHEFADMPRLRAELNGERPAPSMQDIIDLIPEEKRLIINIDRPDEESE